MPPLAQSIHRIAKMKIKIYTTLQSQPLPSKCPNLSLPPLPHLGALNHSTYPSKMID